MPLLLLMTLILIESFDLERTFQIKSDHYLSLPSLTLNHLSMSIRLLDASRIVTPPLLWAAFPNA